MDRYFYDTLVDVAGPASWGWLRTLAAITPEPTIAMLLDAEPEEAYARKGERSLEELRQRSISYRRVFRWLRAPVIIRPMELTETSVLLARVVESRLAG